MAKMMSYTTADGVTHTNSYWRPVQLNFNLDGSGLIVFLGYHDVTARQASKNPIDSHSYPLNASLMVQYFAVSNYVNGVNPTSQSYVLAVATLDTNGQSFFNGASNV